MDERQVVVLKDEDIKEVERLSLLFPAKSGNRAESVIKNFIDHISKVYGTDMGFLTEEQYEHEMGKQFDKKSKRRVKLGRKQSRDDPDYF